MSRAILLATPGDPFLIAYWLRNYDEWRELARIDELLVCVSWPTAPDVLEHIRFEVAARGGITVYHGARGLVEHGEAIKLLLPFSSSEYVMLAEDDVYFRTPGFVCGTFDVLEGPSPYEVAGIPGVGMSAELQLAGTARGWQGPGLRPMCLFARREALAALTEGLCARNWVAGEHVVGLNYLCREPCSADTFAAASFELLALYNVFYLPQPSAAGPYEHAGSLSTGPYVADDVLAYEATINLPGWKTRLSWWETFWREWPGGLEDEYERYGSALERIRARLYA